MEPPGDYADAAGNVYLTDDNNECIRRFGVDQLRQVSSDSPDPVIPGTPLRYDLRVANHAPDTVKGVSLTLTAKNGLSTSATGVTRVARRGVWTGHQHRHNASGRC